MTEQQPETDVAGVLPGEMDKHLDTPGFSTGDPPCADDPEVPDTEDEAPEFTDDDGVAGDDEGSDDE
jgi:hypothetical protein